MNETDREIAVSTGKCPECDLPIIAPASGSNLKQPDIRGCRITCPRCKAVLSLEPISIDPSGQYVILAVVEDRSSVVDENATKRAVKSGCDLLTLK